MTTARYALVVAVQTIRSHRLRTILTALAIVLGVLALVTVDSAAGAAESAVVDSALLANGLPATWAVNLQPGLQLVGRAAGAAGDIDGRVESRGGAAALEMDGSAALEFNGQTGSVNLVAVAGPLLAVRPLHVVAGAWPETPRGLRPVVVVNSAAARSGIRVGDAIGLRVGSRATMIASGVVGVVNDGQSDPTVYVPAPQLAWWRPTIGADMSARILLHVPDGSAEDEVQTLVAGSLARSGLQGSNPVRLDDLSGQMTAVQTLRLAFLTVAGLGLLTGMLGILNIGLAALPERVVELSLRRAAGATRRSIVVVMMTESVLVGAAAASLAVAGAFLLYPVTSRMIFPQIPASAADQFPLLSAIVGIAAGMLAGLLGGLIPALRAAAMDIASIMRA